MPATGQIGLFKIVSEGAVAAGVRRVEAITADKAEEYYKKQNEELQAVKELLKNPKDVVKGVQALMDENVALQLKIASFTSEKTQQVKNDLIKKVKPVNGINLIAEKIELPSADAIKNLSFELRNQIDNLFLFIGSEIEGKAHLSLIISDNLVKDKNLNAINIIRELSKDIQGGGGGQAFYATAGGKNPQGIEAAIEKAKAILN